MSAAEGSRIVVLDDDPTGTQTVADLPIVLDPGAATLTSAAACGEGPVWVLTNTRAMRRSEAESFLAATAEGVAAAFGPAVRLVLRGDSTLRGHVLPEIDTLSGRDSVALFVPAFIEQGRVTINGVHYVLAGDRRVEVASTEYACDPEFGYHTSDLVRWISEREPGRPAWGMPREVLRSKGAAALAELLASVPARSVVVPDAETTADLEVIHAAWIMALERGRDVVLRCASSMASVVTGRPPKAITLEPVSGPVMVVCGSYTSGATEQLAALDGLESIARLEIDLMQALSSQTVASNYCRALANRVADSLRTHEVTVLSTPRRTQSHNLNFAAGEQIMNTIVGVVGEVQGKFRSLITKGGITSARIPRDALGVRMAEIRGQVLPGIPVWEIDVPSSGTIDQVIIPGNVGQRTAIREVVRGLTGH